MTAYSCILLFKFISHYLDIVEMDSKRTAHEKMLCITECSKNIYKAINISANIRHNINEANNASTLSESAAAATATTEESTNKSASRSVASADDYLPAFIYIVLKANPTMLYSNMNFISRFAFEKRVLQGEHAYHFCSLVIYLLKLKINRHK